MIKIQLNDRGRQKLKWQISWQQVEHAKLYNTQSTKRGNLSHFRTLGRGDLNFCILSTPPWVSETRIWTCINMCHKTKQNKWVKREVGNRILMSCQLHWLTSERSDPVTQLLLKLFSYICKTFLIKYTKSVQTQRMDHQNKFLKWAKPLVTKISHDNWQTTLPESICFFNPCYLLYISGYT